MSFAISDSTNVTVRNWSVIQPQFWASIVIRSENVLYKNYYVNATSYDPASNVHRLNWLQNTDGCDTYKSHNVTFGGCPHCSRRSGKTLICLFQRTWCIRVVTIAWPSRPTRR